MNKLGTKTAGLAMIVGFMTVSLLGGCNFAQESAVLYRGPTPSIKRLDELKKLGIRTIVSVRTNPTRKEAEYARRIGMKFFHIRTGVFRRPSHEQVDQFLSIVSKPENQPVYVCCVGGRDRTSFYVAVYKIAMEGFATEKAVADMNARRLRKWWPAFGHYDDILKEHYDELHGKYQAMKTGEGAGEHTKAQ